ncbi:O-antigen ligase family protein [Euzebya sp.]|uniref:O-antigen ligase family protein n=1 Tax=Euzebya sp. TaxID=1971409 RepID=UPI0035185F62
MSAALELVAVAVLGLVGLVVIDRALLRRDLPWLIVAGGVVVREVVQPLPRLEVGGIAVYPEDVVTVLVGVVLAAWLLRGAALRTPQLLVCLALALVGISIARGAAQFGLPAAINEARETLYFLGGVLLGSFAPVDAAGRARLARGWLVVAGGLVVLAVIRWGIVVFDIPLRGGWYIPDFGGLRVLYASGSLAIAIAYLIVLPRLVTGRAGWADRLMALAFAGTVVVLQHRSVWAVALLGTAATVVWLRHALDRRVVAVVVVGGVLLSIAALTTLDTGALVARASETDAADSNTWEWRTSGWADLIATASRQSGPVEVLLGLPYGTGWLRSVSAGFDVTVPPHNFYLEIGLRIGVLGLGLVVAPVAWAVRRLARRLGEDGAAPLAAGTLLVITLVCATYGVPYNLQTEQGLLIGLAIAVACATSGTARGIVLVPPASADGAVGDPVEGLRGAEGRVDVG